MAERCSCVVARRFRGERIGVRDERTSGSGGGLEGLREGYGWGGGLDVTVCGCGCV